MENILTIQETTVLFARHTIHSDFPWVDYTLPKRVITRTTSTKIRMDRRFQK